MKKLSLVLVMFSMVGTAVAQRQTPQAQVRAMSLMDCIQEALQQNLDLQIERYNPKLSAVDLQGAYAGYDPIFNFSGQHNFARSGGGFSEITGTNTPSIVTDQNSFSSSLGGVLPWGLDYRLYGNVAKREFDPIDQTGGRVGFELSQPLLKNFWIDGTRLRVALAKIGLRASDLGLRLQMMSVVTSVEKAYFDLMAARENVKVQEKAQQLAEQLLAENKKRVEVGTLAPLDEKQAESQVASRRADVLVAQRTASTAQATLRGLLNMPITEEIDPVETLSPPVENFDLLESLKRGMEQRPEILRAKLELERQGIQLKYDQNQLFPQLDLVGGYAHASGGVGINEYSDAFGEFRRGNQPSHYYGATLTIPLSNRAARNAYRASKLVNEQRFLEVKRIERGIVTEIENFVVAARTSYQSLDSRRQARLYAEAALDAEQKKLQNGKSTSFQVLQLQRDLTAARSEEIRALADYHKSLADLARGEGATLERRKIDLPSQ